MIAIDLSKQQALDEDPKAMQQINFTVNLENNAVISFIIVEQKNCFIFFTRNYNSIIILLIPLI